MAETLRWDVLALLRKVRVFTCERRMASLAGGFFAPSVTEEKRRARRAGYRKGRRILVILDCWCEFEVGRAGSTTRESLRP